MLRVKTKEVAVYRLNKMKLFSYDTSFPQVEEVERRRRGHMRGGRREEEAKKR